MVVVDVVGSDGKDEEDAEAEEDEEEEDADAYEDEAAAEAEDEEESAVFVIGCESVLALSWVSGTTGGTSSGFSVALLLLFAFPSSLLFACRLRASAKLFK